MDPPATTPINPTSRIKQVLSAASLASLKAKHNSSNQQPGFTTFGQQQQPSTTFGQPASTTSSTGFSFGHSSNNSLALPPLVDSESQRLVHSLLLVHLGVQVSPALPPQVYLVNLLQAVELVLVVPPSTTTTRPTFGSAFGQQAGTMTGSAFGSAQQQQPSTTTSIFGSTQPSPLFGSTTQPTTSTFGGISAQPSSPFGGVTSTQPTGTAFGAPQRLRLALLLLK